MRKKFLEFLMEIAEKDDKVFFITGDLGFEFNTFKERFPNRYLNIGACEQSMIGVAAGMALGGLKPWVYSITPFLLERPFEQIKIDLNQQKSNVKLVGFADYPDMGPTHAELDWKIIGKMFENTKCFFPLNLEEAKNSFYQAYNYEGPCIISLKKAKPDNTLKHYICVGLCKGISDKTGMCQAEKCNRYNHALIECDCIDGLHKSI